MLKLAPELKQDATLPKITKVAVTQFRYSVKNAARDDTTGKLYYCIGAQAEMPSFAIRVHAGDHTGEYVAHMGGRPPVLAQVLSVAKLAVGQPLAAGASFTNRSNKHLQTFGGLGTGAIDIALWDLLAKSLDTSVSNLIGKFRSKLPAYASLIHGNAQGDLTDGEGLRDAIASCLSVGLTGIKFRGRPGSAAHDYVNAIEVAASTVPSDAVRLFLDPGCDLERFSDALFVGRAADAARLFWLEDLIRDSGKSLAAHRRLRGRIQTPLLCGEHIRGLEAKAEWVSGDATDFIRADPELDGGITGCLKIAHLAEAFGMDVELHGSGPAHRVAMAAIRNTNFYELGLALPDGTNVHAPTVYADGYSDDFSALDSNSCVTVPNGPGLGVTYDWDRISAGTKEVFEFS